MSPFFFKTLCLTFLLQAVYAVPVVVDTTATLNPTQIEKPTVTTEQPLIPLPSATSTTGAGECTPSIVTVTATATESVTTTATITATLKPTATSTTTVTVSTVPEMIISANIKSSYSAEVVQITNPARTAGIIGAIVTGKFVSNTGVTDTITATTDQRGVAQLVSKTFFFDVKISSSTFCVESVTYPGGYVVYNAQKNFVPVCR